METDTLQQDVMVKREMTDESHYSFHNGNFYTVDLIKEISFYSFIVETMYIPALKRSSLFLTTDD